MFDFLEIDRTICDGCAREKALTSIDRRGILLNSHDFNALTCAQERRQSAATSKNREPPCSTLTEERQLRRDLTLQLAVGRKFVPLLSRREIARHFGFP
jgi:hypothetical protein